jgi:hypothetical protein
MSGQGESAFDLVAAIVRLEKIRTILGPLPNVELYVSYLQRGKSYAINVLAPGGMGASKGVTLTAKFKNFFLEVAGRQKLREITQAQWVELWSILDELAKGECERAVAVVQNFRGSNQPNSNAETALTQQPRVTLEIDGKEVDLSVPEPIPWPHSIASWVDEVARVSSEVANIQFYFGDLLNQGIAAFGEVAAYARAMAVSGRDRETLRFYAWVARKVPKHRRVKELTFNHHRAVAALDQACQATLLARAVEENLPVKAVQQIASCKSAVLTPATVGTSRAVHCLVTERIYKDLEKFAADWDCTVDRVVQLAVVQYMLAKRAEARQQLVAMEALVPAASSSEPA